MNGFGYSAVNDVDLQPTTTPTISLPSIMVDSDIPILTYSSYFGASDGEESYSIAIDDAGNYYFTGYTISFNFPTYNAYQDELASWDYDAFVVKFNKNHELVYSTYLGGTTDEKGLEVAVDHDGNCIVVGYTGSDDFPTKDAFNATYSYGYDVFLAKFDSTGDLVFSTYLGGSAFEQAKSVAVDENNNIYITGETYSTDFPTTLNAFDDSANGQSDIFLSKFSSEGDLLYSSYFGGSSGDVGYSIIADENGDYYFTGNTQSTNFPLHNEYDDTLTGSSEVFVTKMFENNTLAFSTYFGGKGSENAEDVAIDGMGNCFITGRTTSDNLTLIDAFDDTYLGAEEAFFAKFDTSGNLVLSSYLGGSYQDWGYGIVCDPDGTSYITGITSSTDFPIVNAYDSSLGASSFDVFLTAVSSEGSLLFSTYYGSDGNENAKDIAYAGQGICYLVGYTTSSTFPCTTNAYNSTYGGISDVFVTAFIYDYFAPQICDLTHSPSAPTDYDEVNITAIAYDNYEMENVTLFVRVNGSDWDMFDMSLLEESTYKISIGYFGAGDFIEYYAKAFDSFGYSETSSIQSFTVTAYFTPEPTTSSTAHSALPFLSVIIITIAGSSSLYLVRKRKER